MASFPHAPTNAVGHPGAGAADSAAWEAGGTPDPRVVGRGEDAWGLYIAVPFCRAKCSFCNFASDVFPAAWQGPYLDALRREMRLTLAVEAPAGPPAVDTVYWGGGTPSLLAPAALAALAAVQREQFRLLPGAEFTCEAMPGTVPDAVCAALAAAGVNRVSLGVQSWDAAEARRVGRRHTAESILADLVRLRRWGLGNLSLDLIAGLPGQTAASWRDSVERTIASGVPHVSVYLFELDADSRLGAEVLAGGRRYGAAEMPDEDEMADGYAWAAERLAAAGLEQYEISSFARAGYASRHNERYWLRQPYVGFGLEAHSFLRRPASRRWGNTAEMEHYLKALAAEQLPRAEEMTLTAVQELEEALFLGLRRVPGVAWRALEAEFGAVPVESKKPAAEAMTAAGLLRDAAGRLALTARGRLLANEVFAEFLA